MITALFLLVLGLLLLLLLVLFSILVDDEQRSLYIVIIDVSSQMFTPVGTISPMELLKPHLSSLICQKIMDSRCGDSLGIIYVNSARTFNALARQGEGAAINKEYQGIEVVRGSINSSTPI